MPCRAMPNAWPLSRQAAPPSAQANGIVIPNRTAPAAIPRTIFIPLFIGSSLVKESAWWSNSSVCQFIPPSIKSFRQGKRLQALDRRSRDLNPAQQINAPARRSRDMSSEKQVHPQVEASTADYSWRHDRPHRVGLTPLD